MDAYFPVMDPIGFFIFTFGPGLLFWGLFNLLDILTIRQILRSEPQLNEVMFEFVY
jgi:hypothetical protein